MRKITVSIAAAIASISVIACLSATGCSTSPTVVATASSTAEGANVESVPYDNDAIAATAGDVSVTETEIANFIAQYRTYIGATDDAEFATLLDEAGMTSSDIREDTIEQLLKYKIAAKKAEENGIAISEDEIDAYIENVKDELGYAENSKGWLDALDISGYDEEAYREDIKTKLIVEQLVGSDAGDMTATEAQMLAYVNDNPSDYVGANVIAVSFKANKKAAAQEFAKANDGDNVSEFRASAAEKVGNGTAEKVEDWGWSCINVPSSVALSAIADMQPGQCAVIQDDDGMYKVIYVTEIFMLQSNGRIDYNNMPDVLKSKLRSDASAANRSRIVAEYLNGLYSSEEVTIESMPEDAPYNVDMLLSTYGVDDGTLTDEEMADAAASQVAQMEQNNQ